MKKRLLAIVMTLAMALSLLPVTALADGVDTESQSTGQVQQDPNPGNTGGGGNDPSLPGDGPDDGNDPSLPGDGPDAGEGPSLNGVLTAAASDAIAAIGDTTYTTLESFASALKEIDSETETTVELRSDLENTNYSSVVDLSLPSNVTLEGNNNTISGNIKITVQQNASNVTIQNVTFQNIHNNVNVDSGSYDFNNKEGNLTAIYAAKLKGKFTVTGCTFENVDWDAIQITPLAGADITITDNTFSTDAKCQTLRFIHVESAQNTDFSILATRNKFYGVEALNQTGLEVYYPANPEKVTLSGNYMDAPMAVCIGTGNSYNNAWQKACPFKDENLEEDIMPIAMREVSAGNRLYLTEEEVAADGVKVLAGENCYDKISAAINAEKGSPVQVKLMNDLSEDVTIPANTTVTLDLNGQTLTNVSSHTIYNQGTLTILDSSRAQSGKVDNTTHAKAALYNKGTITEISGGTFTRSQEVGTTAGGNGNSWYTVYNAGTIEKITGGTFENKGTYSSMLVNGWNNPGPEVQGYIGTISGGTFTGGSITIKNDDGGKIDKICGDAVITNKTQTAIQNTSTIGEISGGTISGGYRAIYNSSWKDGTTEYIGTLTIKDGAVIEGGINNTNWGGGADSTAQFAKTTIVGGKISGTLQDDNKGTSGCQIVISGGYFTADPTDYLADGKDAVASNETGYQYMVGTLALSQQSLALTKGGEASLSVSAEPWGAVPAAAVTWSSSNEAVATVDNNGTVTAVAAGTATITAEVNGKPLTCTVTVSYAGVEGITLDRSELTLLSGGSTALTATVSPANADQTVTWTSSDEAVATVDENGTVTALAAGTATITASAGAYSASCTVTVTGTDVDVLPSTEATETKDALPEGLDETTAEAVNEAAGTVKADSALSTAAQEQAGQLADSAEKDQLLADGQTQLGGAEDVALFTQVYLEVTSTDAQVDEDGNVTAITLDIAPKIQVVASTASTAADVELGAGGNAVVVKEASDLKITTSTVVELTLPVSFANQTVYIKHEASNGRTYFYTADADGDANLTFTTHHGFSPFTFSLTNEAAAQVGAVGYADLQDAIDAVADGGTITVLKDDLGTVTIQGNKTFTLKKGEGVETLPTLKAASGYRLTDDGNGTYTISRRSSGGGGSGGSATYTVSVDSGRHGDVTVSHKSASKGTTVTITVKPDEGYELDELTVTDQDGDTVKLTKKSDTKYTFTMPASKVTVEALFAALEPEEEEPLFSDVEERDWYYDAVAYVAENGIMSGTDGSRFSPNGTLTRAMLSQILYAMEDKPAVSGAGAFSDVAPGAWYADAVNWTAAQGIVAGMGENSFAPDAPVTREQLSLILYGYARYKGYDTSASVSLSGYADRDSVAVWAADSMGWAVAEGLISGRPGGYLDPAGTATRAEVAQILMNFCEDLAS